MVDAVLLAADAVETAAIALLAVAAVVAAENSSLTNFRDKN